MICRAIAPFLVRVMVIVIGPGSIHVVDITLELLIGIVLLFDRDFALSLDLIRHAGCDEHVDAALTSQNEVRASSDDHARSFCRKILNDLALLKVDRIRKVRRVRQ